MESTYNKFTCLNRILIEILLIKLGRGVIIYNEDKYVNVSELTVRAFYPVINFI